jgi:hypothetical protein
MQSIRQGLTAAAGLVIVVAALGIIGSEPARAAKTDDVKVVNTLAEPVPTLVTNNPLPVAGSVTAHIDNATLPVSGTVAVSSLPAVTLSGTPQVSLSNTSSTPLFVDTGGPTRAAIGSQCFDNFDATGSANCLLATVPANHTLVIETITCTASVANGTPLVPIVLNMGGPPIGGGAPISLNHRLLMTHAASITGGLDYYGLTAQVRMYAAGGNGGSTGVSVFVGVGPGSANQGGLGCAISGHMASQ